MGMELHDHSTHHSGGMVADIRHGLHAMPTWGWVVTAGGAGVLLLIWMRRSSASNAASTVPVLASPATVASPGAAGTGATVVGGTGSTDTSGPTGQDLYNLIIQSQQQTEQDLLSYLASLGGTNTNGSLPPNLVPTSNPPPIDPGTAPVGTTGGGTYGTTPPPAAMLDPIFYNDPQFVPGAGATPALGGAYWTGQPFASALVPAPGYSAYLPTESNPSGNWPAVAPAAYANLDAGASVHQVGGESYTHPAQQPSGPPPGSALTSFYDPNAASNALAQLLRQNGIGAIQGGH